MRLAVIIALFGVVACAADETIVPAADTGPKSPDVTGGGENRPPELFKIGDRVVAVGNTLVITPQASDPDDDDLTFSVFGDIPDDAVFRKNPPRFEWTPSSAPMTLYTTFVVSDGLETDRETVVISVVSESSNHPPVFQKVSDQAVEVEQQLILQLQATDPDGDSLTFSAEGPLPAGASLDPNTGRFRWTPAASLAGTEANITFQVTDQIATASLPVRIVVLAPGQNKPPTFAPVPPQSAKVGQAYALVLVPSDPENDSLSCGMEGTPPTGAKFNPEAHTLTWTPTADQAGKTWSFVFWVSDGNYKVLVKIDIQVQDPSVGPGICKDDVNEPNNSGATATQVTVGSYEKLSICDTELSPVDEDWFAVSLSSGQTLSVKLTFEHDEGDLDLAVHTIGSTSTPVAISESATDDEQLSYPAPTPGTYLVRVYGTGQATFSSNYTMTISTSGLGCQDDPLEPNDTPQAPTPLLGNDQTGTLNYCPADLDWFSVPAKCGETVTATLTAQQSQGNLDLYLYRASAPTEPVASSTATTGSAETAAFTAPLNENILVLVRGEPAESTQNTYSLSTKISGGITCTDDAKEPNDSKLKATELSVPEAEVGGLKLCCNADWFFMPLSIGDGALISLTFPEGAKVRAELYTLDSNTPVAKGEPDNDGLLVTLTQAKFTANYYLRVEGDPGTTYAIEMVVLENDGCLTSKGCGDNEVCYKATGQCKSDFCLDESDCPAGQEMPCEANYCLDGCTYEADCKLEYACKGFPFGRYCGPEGSTPLGGACSDFTDCAGPASCAFPGSGGYCTLVGCKSNAECVPLGGQCVQHKTQEVCGKPCDTNDDCRSSEGYTCQPKTLPNGIPTQVCLPTS